MSQKILEKEYLISNLIEKIEKHSFEKNIYIVKLYFYFINSYLILAQTSLHIK